MSRIALLLVLACAIIAPKIGSLDYPIVILLMTYLFLVIKKRANKNIIYRKYYNILLLWILLIVWSIIVYAINGEINSTFILKPLRQILLLTLILSIVRKTNITFNEVLKIIIIAATINSIIICLQIYANNFLGMPGFLMTSSFDKTLDVPFRKPGLMAGYPQAGLLSLIAIICLLSIMRYIKIIHFLLLIILLTFSLIVTSRTTLLLSVFPFSVLFIYSLKSKRVMVKFLMFIIFGLWSITLIINILPEDTYKVAFEMFINYSNEGSLTTTSSQALNSSYILPEKISTIFLGNGLNNRTDIDTNIDDGYQVLIYGGGVLYFIVILLLFYYYYKITLKSCNTKDKKITIYLIYFILLIANYKTDCLFSRVTSDCIVLFLSVSLNYRSLSIKNKIKTL